MYLRKFFLIIESKFLLLFLLIVSLITLLIELFNDSNTSLDLAPGFVVCVLLIGVAKPYCPDKDCKLVNIPSYLLLRLISLFFTQKPSNVFMALILFVNPV